MADRLSQFLPFDLDTGGGEEYVLGVGLRISDSGGSIEAKGESTMALSLPVVIASDQAAIDVSKSTVTVADDGSFVLAANSGIDIGDVDVTSIIPLTGATNLGKAIDVAAGSDDVGVAVLAVRDDALAGITPAEGDFASLLVDAQGALWTHDDALDAALDGTEIQVDIVAELPAGTQTIGKLGANTGVDIGDVDVTSILPGVGTTNLGKTIDVAVGADDVGVLALAVRDDALGGITPAEGDVTSLLVDDNGALWCNVNNTVDVAATDLDIRDLSEASDQVLVFANTIKDGSGTDYVPLVDADAHLQVDVLSGGGEAIPTSPVVEPETGAATASAAEEDLTTAEAANKKLTGIDIWCSQRFKFTIHTVDDGVESGIMGVGGGDASQGVQWRSPHRDFITLGAEAGLDAFRVVIKNLGNLAADTHAVFFYED